MEVGRQEGSGGRTKSWSGVRGQSGDCFRCTGRWFDEEAHSYLLGIYLGDGCLSRHPSDVFKLRIACDLKYPEIINEIATHIVLAQANDEVGFVVAEGCVEAYSYWKHWICLFPQHGTGKKRER